jgi:protein HOOK1
MTKLKSDISDNKRLKANNLRKIINGITDYTNNVIGLQLVDFQMPDSNRAAEGNIQDVGRIIQVNKRQKNHIGQGFPT